MIGEKLGGFNILEKLNRGGMADIYHVSDTAGHEFVLRVLLPEFRWRWARIRQFNWGCKVLSQLGPHPNIIRYYGTGRDEGLRYAVLEYIAGPNLRDKILRADPLLEIERLKLLRGMATGLAHVHEHGFIHLDFKPENVLVPEDYEPKLVDFDLSARRPRRPLRLKSLSGTLSYWAPEQILRQPIDERADIFAFGMTAYELVTGRKPFTGNTREEILEKYKDFKQHLVPPRSRVPALAVAIERVILKCLEKDPAHRYPSMRLVVRDLHT